jgi:hypothetical protein
MKFSYRGARSTTLAGLPGSTYLMCLSFRCEPGGHLNLPVGGRETCPLTVTRSGGHGICRVRPPPVDRVSPAASPLGRRALGTSGRIRRWSGRRARGAAAGRWWRRLVPVPPAGDRGRGALVCAKPGNAGVTMGTIALTMRTFGRAVSRDGATLVYFWAPWCGPRSERVDLAGRQRPLVPGCPACGPHEPHP